MKRGFLVVGSLTQRPRKRVVPFGDPLLTAAQTSLQRWWKGRLCWGMAGRKSKTPVPPTRTGACSEDLPVQWKGQPQRAKESIEVRKGVVDSWGRVA